MNMILIRKKTIVRMVNIIASVIANSQEFKIGKTGDTVENRRKEPDYNNDYPHVERLYSSKYKFMVDFMEAFLIDSFIDNNKCANDKNGKRSINDNMTLKAEKYSVYIVWK